MHFLTLLRPYHMNFGKRFIQSPKLYFLDTGLLGSLLQIRSPGELFHRAERGAVFESLVVSELHKNFMHCGGQPSLYFRRTWFVSEVGIVIDLGKEVIPVEAKPAQTVAPGFLDNLAYWRKLAGDETGPAALIYGGRSNIQTLRGGRVPVAGVLARASLRWTKEVW